METPSGVHPATPRARHAARKSPAVRSILLALAAAWFLLTSFLRVDENSAHGLVDLVQRLAFGFALLAAALVDWRSFRWWWVIVGLVVLGVTWTATGHPLLFLVGGI